MIAVKGVYEHGSVILSTPVPIRGRVEVIVTFLDGVSDNEPVKTNQNLFSFAKSREILKGYKGSIAEAVIDERRGEV